jgi:hypothetical protein
MKAESHTVDKLRTCVVMDELEEESFRLPVINKCPLPSSGLELRLELSIDS